MITMIINIIIIFFPEHGHDHVWPRGGCFYLSGWTGLLGHIWHLWQFREHKDFGLATTYELHWFFKLSSCVLRSLPFCLTFTTKRSPLSVTDETRTWISSAPTVGSRDFESSLWRFFVSIMVSNISLFYYVVYYLDLRMHHIGQDNIMLEDIKIEWNWFAQQNIFDTSGWRKI